MKRKSYFLRVLSMALLVFLAFAVPRQLFAQDAAAINGTILDSVQQTPLPGASIVVKGTGNGTSSDLYGGFTIQAARGDILVISMVGYRSMEVPVSGTTMNIRLQQDVAALDEVVVVGYGTERREDLTGAISSVSSKDWENAPIISPDQILQGRVSGVQVSTNSHEPGGGISIRIRGTASLNAGGSPLYVIDGMPISSGVETGPGDGGTTGTASNPLNSIDPSTIASINVLKDASAAAIYGSRAANGVVLITTKAGVSGQQQINFETSLGIQQVTNKLDFMSAEDWGMQANERANQLGLPSVYTQEQIAAFGRGTDWQEEIFRPAMQQRYNLTFSGGTDKIRYLLSGSHMNSEGIVRGSEFQRYGATVRVDATPSKRFSAGGSLMFTANSNNQVRTDTKGYEGVSNVIDALLEAPSTIPARDSAGSITNMSDFTLGGGLENPLTITDKYKQRGNALRLINNLHASYDITGELTLFTRLGADIYDFRYHEYFPIGSEASVGADGIANQQATRNINILTESTLTFQKDISEKHSLKILAGFTYQQEKSEGLNAGSHGFPSDYYLYNNLGLGTDPQSPGSDLSQWQLVSYIGRANYSFNDKYLLTASIRMDGSSKFGANNKYGVFP